MKVQQKTKEIMRTLQAYADPKAIESMARFGINTERVYGVSIPVLRKLAKDIGKNHLLAQRLWESEIHEARILASMVAEANAMTSNEMDRWAAVFNSWDLCDQVCMNVFEDSVHAYDKAIKWCHSDHEFIKRAGFVMMARLAVSDKKADDNKFIPFLRYIILYATDDRNFVKKAVNWALRQIGKRNKTLNMRAVSVAHELKSNKNKSARWVGTDALRELQNEAVRQRLKK